ncbi:acyltransferase [Aquirufa sp. OSTEICH-129V]|uniref:Acyltransferase n=1 Tax=Aquirufa avitistagni TaxID=3104728 RepID=A0ABW6DDD1_9BACT
MISSKPVYFEQLNGIRFIAVFLVLIDHWLIPINPFSFFGHLGVVMFFVLSGFLITRILFENADSCRAHHSSPIVKMVRFIYRRSLRIFPIYFLLLAVGGIFSLSNFSEIAGWLISYTPNFYIILHNRWMGVWDHLWSLAVEEQYYLFFPYFIFFISAAKYPRLLIWMLLIGIGSRLSFFLLASHEVKESFWMISYVNPLAAIDSFGLGGILAYLYHYKNEQFVNLVSRSYFLPISLLAFVGILYLSHVSINTHDNIWAIVFERFFAGLFSFFLIAQAIGSRSWMLGRFLTFSWVSYIGQISYGIYLYHNVVYNYYHEKGNTIIGYLATFLPNLNVELPNFILIKFVLSVIIVIILASFSWFFIEKPINRFKNRI